jgi:hypothetical protein
MKNLVVISTAPITVILPLSAAFFNDVSLFPMILDFATPVFVPIGCPVRLYDLDTTQEPKNRLKPINTGKINLDFIRLLLVKILLISLFRIRAKSIDFENVDFQGVV